MRQFRIENHEEEVNNTHNDADELEMLDAEAEFLTGDTLNEPSQDASQPNPVQQLLRDMQTDVCPAHPLHRIKSNNRPTVQPHNPSNHPIHLQHTNSP